MATESYGDVVALSLVLASAILIAVFVWLLMRKYRMEMHKNDLCIAPKLASPPVDRTTHLAASAVRGQAAADLKSSTAAGQAVMNAIPLEEKGACLQADGSSISRAGADDKTKLSADVKKKQPAHNGPKPSADDATNASAVDEINFSAGAKTKSAAESKRKQKDGSKVSRRKDSRRSSAASGERSSTVKRKSKRRRSRTASADSAKSKTGDEPSVTSSSRLDKEAQQAAEIAATSRTTDATAAPTTGACDVTENRTVADDGAKCPPVSDQSALASTAKPSVGHGAGVPSADDGGTEPTAQKFDIVGSPVVCGGLSSPRAPARGGEESEHVQSFLTPLPGIFSATITSPETRSTTLETPAPDRQHQKQLPTQSSAPKDPTLKPSTDEAG